MDRAVKISKTLSYWLRHDPAAGGLRLDDAGWADLDDVLAAFGRALRPAVTLPELERVVATSDKQRFTILDGRVRANQGHSVEVDMRFERVEPPPALYHGTTRERWARIQQSGGLSRMRRHHVHLSGDVETALRVAGRHRGEEPLVLRVGAAAARARGHEFFLSENGVYLTDAVPLEFLSAAGHGDGDERDR
jgi:putative RNA 2'-phosphotransferase